MKASYRLWSSARFPSGAQPLLERAKSKEGMTLAGEYLLRATRLNNEIALMLARADDIRRRSVGIQAMSLAHAAPGGISDPVGDAAQALADLEADVLSAYQRLTAFERDVRVMIERLGNPLHRVILHMRYLDGKPFPVIAAHLNFHESHIYKLHRKALALVALALLTDGTGDGGTGDDGGGPGCTFS